MKLSKKQLAQAVEKDIISAEQLEPLFEFLTAQTATEPKFDFTHVLYYLGGLIAIGAMTLFMTLGWEALGGWGIFFITLLYAGVGFRLTQVFQQRDYAIPAALSATFIVALTPLAIYGLQQGLGLWPDNSDYRDYHRYIQWHWLYMELGTLAVGAIMVWRYKYPFLMMPVAVTLWYLSMDIAAMLIFDWPDFELRALVSLYFGLLMILLAFWVDIRSRFSRTDYAFWLYIFGVMAFWCGLTMQDSDSELNKFLYFITNLLLMSIGVVLARRVFVIFAAFGVCGYLGYLSYEVFEDSLMFPIALSFIGLFIIYLGIVWQKNEHHISQWLRQKLPQALAELLTR